MTSVSLLKNLLAVSTVLVLIIYFQYPTSSFPIGLEALECLLSIIILVVSGLFVIKFRDRLSKHFYKNNILLGLSIGLLWTIEISINNFIQPGLPLRDIVDDVFWGLIACLILFLAIADSLKSKKILTGVKSGLLTGFSSGVVACLTTLLLITFGMQLILKDPLNIREWAEIKNTSQYPGMAVYFAYQTLAGAIMHLIILGVIMGLLLGVIGGLISKLINSFKEI